jgi:cell division protein FtsN
MKDRTAEPGYELVLDNRKLIVTFAVLIAICGCFFVVGFIEGKRQGIQVGAQTAAESAAKAKPAGEQAQATRPDSADPATKPLNGGSSEQQLDWYKNVRENEPGGIMPQTPQNTTAASVKNVVEPPVKPKSQANAAHTAELPKPQANVERSEPVTYSVQVGAFRQRKQGEIRAEALKSKGFDCRIEPPHNSDQLYLLKVGKFSSRAEAVAMQLRLKKGGFTSAFIKTN